MDLMQYVKPELFCLVAVLWFLGTALKKTPRVPDWMIPYLLTALGILLSAGWMLALEPPGVMTAFTAVTQGVLVAGVSVYGNQLLKQARKARGEEGHAQDDC